MEKLYSRYEARLGTVMSKTLGQHVLNLLNSLAFRFLPIPSEKQPALEHYLEVDRFVRHALSSAMCELCHCHGMSLSRISAALTTAKYCEFRDQCPRISYSETDNNSGDVGKDTILGSGE